MITEPYCTRKAPATVVRRIGLFTHCSSKTTPSLFSRRSNSPKEVDTRQMKCTNNKFSTRAIHQLYTGQKPTPFGDGLLNNSSRCSCSVTSKKATIVQEEQHAQSQCHAKRSSLSSARQAIVPQVAFRDSPSRNATKSSSVGRKGDAHPTKPRSKAVVSRKEASARIWVRVRP